MKSEAVLREYMRVIHQSNIGAVCVESRPYPDFCGEGWWRDMDIILDAACNHGYHRSYINMMDKESFLLSKLSKKMPEIEAKIAAESEVK